MIDLQEYKLPNSEIFNQVFLLDNSGRVINSCNSIFDTAVYINQSIVTDIPFLESIFDIVQSHNPNSPEIEFKKVENPFYLLQGIYDCSFSIETLDNQSFILWTVFDRTSDYQRLIKHQQRRNESEINRQLRKLAMLSKFLFLPILSIKL